ncbi:hypothetical protein CK203_099773 [Vitis vinifera]|uniref:Retrotransposon gag domain-containing protein n=1 Tax=Vitis vinifera TaxID=29760 RepID=A0A438C6W4_VITVI|nr:hypothetical protein CK203_099773 [Vitis vinifera]
MQGKNNGEEEKQSEEENRGQQLQSSCALLEHFPKSIFYILYTISKLRKSRIQCFKRLFVQCYGIPPEATRYMLQAGTLRTSRWKPISQPYEFNLLLGKYFAALLSVCEISQTPFSPAKWKYPRKAKLPSYINSLVNTLKTLGEVINFVDHSLNQGAPAGHESAETPIGHESNGAVAGDRTPNQMVPLPLPLLGTNQMAPLPGMVPLYSDITFSRVLVIFITIVHAILNTIAEEAMNFMSYVAEVSRGWDEPNARDMGRMTSQPNAKGEMYILNDGMNMKAEIAAMERRLEELEMTNMQPVQAISQTPLQAMPCAICLSYEHLVDECPTIPAEREMFGDCNTYNSNWRDHPNFSWKPQPPQYQQPAQAPQQASNLEQAIVNLCKVVGDFVRKQEAINAQINQRIDRVESTLNKRMDEMQNDLSQKLDILQDSISRLVDFNTMQEKENSPSQPYQNSMSIHEMEVEEGEPSQEREVKEVITLRSGKEVDLPTCKLEHKVESETEKEKREEIKGKKKGKSTEKDDYIDEEPQMIVIKEELMKKHMPPPFLQALYDKIIQITSQVKDANFIWDPGKLNQDQIF